MPDVEQGVVVESFQCLEQPMTSGMHLACLVPDFAQLVAGGWKVKAMRFSVGSALDNPFCPYMCSVR